MLERYWVVIFALGLALPTYAQEGVGIEGPAVPKQATQEPATSTGQSNQPALPVVIVETPEQASHAAEREAKADQHEADDLAAQQKAADAADRGATAADRQIIPTWLQVGFAAIGSLLLVWTLRLNSLAAADASRAAVASMRAADAAEKAYMADNRPWLKLEVDKIADFNPAKMVEVHLTVQNLGKSPALDARIWIKAYRVRVIQIDKGHVAKFVENRIKSAPYNTYQSAVVLPTVKLITRQDAELEDLGLPGKPRPEFWLGLICVCTYRSNLSDKFFHTTETVLVKAVDGSLGKGITRSAALKWETVHNVASID